MENKHESQFYLDMYEKQVSVKRKSEINEFMCEKHKFFHGLSIAIGNAYSNLEECIQEMVLNLSKERFKDIDPRYLNHLYDFFSETMVIYDWKKARSA